MNRLEGLRGKLLAGASIALLALVAIPHPAAADKLDEVLARLQALEKSNAKLAKENAKLRERVDHIAAAKSGGAVAAGVKGNPVGHAAVAPSPKPEHTVVSIGGTPLYTKAPGGNKFIDNTTVTLYGHVDLSLDMFNPGVFDQGTKEGIASNLSSFGVRIRHDLAAYGHPGWAAVAQYEVARRSRGHADGTRGVWNARQLHRHGIAVGCHQGRQVRYAV